MDDQLGLGVDENLEKIGAAIGHIPSGCSILTVAREDRATGLLVSWVQQASFDPPLVSVCIKSGRPASQMVEASECFLLNIIGDDPSEMFKHFGKGFAPDDDAFVGISTRTTQFGPLIESCIAHLGCRVTDKLAAGDHDLFIGEVVAGGVVDGTKPYIHIRRNGLSY